jgi:hypothetical protein
VDCLDLSNGSHQKYTIWAPGFVFDTWVVFGATGDGIIRRNRGWARLFVYSRRFWVLGCTNPGKGAAPVALVYTDIPGLDRMGRRWCGFVLSFSSQETLSVMSFILFLRVVGPLKGGNRLGNWAEGTGVSLYTVDTICCGSEGDTLRVEMVVMCRSGGLGLDWPRILRLSKAKRTSTPGCRGWSPEWETWVRVPRSAGFHVYSYKQLSACFVSLLRVSSSRRGETVSGHWDRNSKIGIVLNLSRGRVE